jgi:hypothetical protein
MRTCRVSKWPQWTRIGAVKAEGVCGRYQTRLGVGSVRNDWVSSEWVDKGMTLRGRGKRRPRSARLRFEMRWGGAHGVQIVRGIPSLARVTAAIGHLPLAAPIAGGIDIAQLLWACKHPFCPARWRSLQPARAFTMLLLCQRSPLHGGRRCTTARRHAGQGRDKQSSFCT